MEKLPYNSEVTHCRGAKRRLCTRCYRYMLHRMWERGEEPVDGAVLVLSGRMEGVTCRTFYDAAKVARASGVSRVKAMV